LTLGGAAVGDFTSSKSPALLAYLITTARPHTRGSLGTLLWQDSPEDRARASLRTVLWDLRQHLAPYLLIDRHNVAFAGDSRHWLDVAQFSRLVEGALPDRASAPLGETELGILTDERARALEAAASLYHGPFMAGFHVSDAPTFEEWVFRKREWARQLAVQAFHRLVLHHTAQATYVPGIDTATRLLEIAPWKEEAYRQLMLVLALSGQRGAALAQYETCRHLLADELGVEPTVETRLLYEQIQSGGPLPGQEKQRAGRALLQRPPRHGLPAPTGLLLGRETELAELGSRLSDPAASPIVLTGPDGVGKTRLAVAAVRSTVQNFEHGAVFVPGMARTGLFETTTGQSDPAVTGERSVALGQAGLHRALAQALGVGFSVGSQIKSALLDYLCHRCMAIILDDLEPGEPLADEILEILNRAPQVVLVVTSRRALGLPDERPLQLTGLRLAPAATHGLSDRPLSYASIQLFAARAGLVHPAFHLRDEDVPDVVRICRSTMGLPLAIEVAAAWIDLLSPAEISRAIQRKVSRVASAQPQMPPPRRAVQAAFNLGWDQLAPALQNGLTQLAVFTEPFTRHSASAIAGVGPADLSLLADKALVQRPAAGRYVWHPLLRELALEKLQANQRPAPGHAGKRLPYPSQLEAVNRNSAHFLDLVSRHTPALYGPQPQAAVAAIRREWEGVRIAWSRAVAQANVDLLTSSLAGLSRFLLLEGPLQEGGELYTGAVSALRGNADLLGDSRGRAILGRLLIEQARFLNEQVRHQAAAAAGEEAITLASANGRSDTELEAAGLMQLGWARLSEGAYPAARTRLKQAVTQARRAGAAALEADCLRHLGLAFLHQEQFEEARDALEPALQVHLSVADRRGEASVRTDLGLVAFQERRYGDARSQLDRALHLFQAIGDHRNAGGAHNLLGRLAVAQGDYPAADTHCQRALTIARDAGDRLAEALALLNLALMLLHEGRNQSAWIRSLQATELARSLGHPATEGRALLVLGHALMELEKTDQAARAYEQAVQLQRTLGQPNLAAESSAGLARVALARGDSGRAQALAEQILSLAQTSGLKGASEPIRVFLTCYQVLRATGDPRAADALSAASGLFDQSGHVPGA
jgi:DNA-binding SARP family transcriptional activator/tetratricopeptide (TPR) repeat protein